MEERKRFSEKQAYDAGYRVTNDGKVLSPKGNEIGFVKMNRTIPYVIFKIRDKYDGKSVPVGAHRLMAYQKYGEKIYEPGILVRHLDGDSLNLKYENIAIGTGTDNNLDIPEDKRKRNVINSTKITRKYSQELIDKIRKEYAEGKRQYILVRENNIPKSTIHHILNSTYLQEKIDNNLL